MEKPDFNKPVSMVKGAGKWPLIIAGVLVILFIVLAANQ
jgi:uncharacterized integral membrane protein